MIFNLKQKNRLVFLATALLTSGLIYWAAGQVDWHSFLVNIQQARVSYLLLAFLSTSLILFLKTFQIEAYLPKSRQVEFLKLFQTTSILMMMVNILPLAGGHAIFIYLLGHRQKLGKTVVLSAVTLDQVLDSLGKLILFVAVAWVVPLPPWMEKGVRAFILLILIAYVALFVLAYGFRKHRFQENSVVGFRRIYHFFTHWAYNLRAIRNYKRVLTAVFYSVLMRVLEAASVYFVQLSFGLELPWFSCVLVVAAISLATVLAVSPGRIGVFEIAIVATYQYLGVNPTMAMTLALFVHMAHTVPFVLVGYYYSVAKGLKRKPISLEEKATALAS